MFVFNMRVAQSARTNWGSEAMASKKAMAWGDCKTSAMLESCVISNITEDKISNPKNVTSARLSDGLLGLSVADFPRAAQIDRVMSLSKNRALRRASAFMEITCRTSRANMGTSSPFVTAPSSNKRPKASANPSSAADTAWEGTCTICNTARKAAHLVCCLRASNDPPLPALICKKRTIEGKASLEMELQSDALRLSASKARMHSDFSDSWVSICSMVASGLRGKTNTFVATRMALRTDSKPPPCPAAT
mmetsp:Transcript_19973/g.41721  ORF Transcript_19973/g.41721 Transcript_19973/m.41721 type:complete len:249 (-) Transcript_19973:3108-3854(-)